MKQRIIKAKMSNIKDSDLFNIAFWKKMSVQKKFSATWELTQDGKEKINILSAKDLIKNKK